MGEERKLVTILFADTTGSTALGEELDPEDVRALMGRYYQHARQVIADHGGTLEQFIGDAVMAVFGLPQAHGNDPERAMAAALVERGMSPSNPDDPAGSVRRSIVTAYHADDPTRFDLDGLVRHHNHMSWELLYLAEHGLPSPGWLIQQLREVGADLAEALAEIAEALADGYNVRLAAAIDAAEARHLIPHAARMRIVLAQRTGDPAPLERARPVLERFGDRQFLHRLEEVGKALGEESCHA